MQNFNPSNNPKTSQKPKIIKVFSKLIKYKWLIILIFSVTIIISFFIIFLQNKFFTNKVINLSTNQAVFTPTPTPILIPESKILPTNYHIFQTFNNCGPAALSMTLRFYNIIISQEELGKQLRPYQITGGDNDDKSVTLKELAEKSKEYGLIPYHRPMGSPQIIKLFIANEIPVITRTWTKPNEDIGHFRVMKGYDDLKQVLIQDDSLQNKNLEYTYFEFNEIWDKFNYEFLVLVPPQKQKIAEQILGENLNEKISWQNAVNNSLKQIKTDPNNIYARFNLSVAYYYVGEFEKSAEEFEKIENQLPFRTLWYQIEPILSYYELGNYEKVFEITDKILNNQNRAFSELYIMRGKIYEKQNKTELAKQEFEKALFYNANIKIL